LSSATHKQGHQGFFAQLTTPVAVHFGVKLSAYRQGIGRVKVVATAEDAAAAVLQSDLHLAIQNEYPLVVA
jgi:hypothetical protein